MQECIWEQNMVWLEQYLFSTGISWLEAKTAIIRDAVRTYLAHPWITLLGTA